jgi:23S rRNA (adenine2503-C2)-methyltransferase
MTKTLEEFIKKNNLPNYKIDQLFQQYYTNPINSWDELTTWSLELREKIKEEIPFSKLTNFKEFKSKDNRTIKTLSFTSEGFPVETVLMKSKSRNTICVSCMSGCPVGCKFCATGQMKFNRNLDTQEIVDQIMYFKRKLYTTGQTITNVVFMGMGEPMLNLDNVIKSIQILTDSQKIGFGHRRITVSTVGYINQLKQFMDKDLGVRIAISLHATNQALREKIMPVVAKENPLTSLIDLLIEYQKKSNKKITYEYMLLNGINDSNEDAFELCKLLKNQIALVNLIKFNSSPCVPYKASNRERIKAFQEILTSRGINNTLRYSYGNDINAACGQLANINS